MLTAIFVLKILETNFTEKCLAKGEKYTGKLLYIFVYYICIDIKKIKLY